LESGAPQVRLYRSPLAFRLPQTNVPQQEVYVCMYLCVCVCVYVRLIHERTVKDSHPVVMWSACGVVVTEATIQMSEKLSFCYRKKMGSLCNNSYPF